jgi:hypothetical protein
MNGNDDRCTTFGGRSVESYETKDWEESRRDKGRPFIQGLGSKQVGAHTTQDWARPGKSPYADSPHTTEADRVHIGDEHSLQGCFQQSISRAFDAAVETKSIVLYFTDFKISGSNYGNIPDVVGLQDVGGNIPSGWLGS